VPRGEAGTLHRGGGRYVAVVCGTCDQPPQALETRLEIELIERDNPNWDDLYPALIERIVVMDPGSRSQRSLGRDDQPSVNSPAARDAIEAVPGIPRDDEGPVFREPWEAQAFAMALALHQRGLFKWPEWAATLAQEIKRAQAAGDPDTGETYYRHWLNALERLVAEKGVTDMATLARYQHAWDHAADRTPHGQPIELQPQDFHTHD
jgi:nitrile hydratase accessory protein